MYSQVGQDVFVLEIFGGLRNGFLLDSGASNGVRVNNTPLLEDAFGWKGICIEINEGSFAELVRNRRCLCLTCCLYDREGNVDFLEQADVLDGILDEYHPQALASRQDEIPRSRGRFGKTGDGSQSRAHRAFRAARLRGAARDRLLEPGHRGLRASDLEELAIR
jgi:hypothetical protein